MAIIRGGSYIGEIRGKIGSVVFSRNAAGMIIRNYAVPVNHRSNAQVRARTAVAVASAAWCQLTDEQKTMWNTFAKDPVRYTPLYSENLGGINGQNAFIGMYVECYTNNELQYGTIIAPTNLTGTAYVWVQEPPSIPVDGTIQGNAIQIISATVTNNTSYIQVTIDIAPVTSPPSPIEIPANDFLRDGHGNPIGFAAYISTPKKNVPNYTRKMEKKIQTTGVIKNTGANPVTVTTLSTTLTRPITDFYKTPQSGEYIDVTVAMIGQNGLARKIGQTTIQVV